MTERTRKPKPIKWTENHPEFPGIDYVAEIDGEDCILCVWQEDGGWSYQIDVARRPGHESAAEAKEAAEFELTELAQRILRDYGGEG